MSGSGGEGGAGGEGEGLEQFRGGGIHTVQRGDTLSAISRRTYGDPAHWIAIRDANPGRVHRGGSLILVNTALVLPVLSVPASQERVDERVCELGEEAVTPATDHFTDALSAQWMASVCEATDYGNFFTTLVLSDAAPRSAALMGLRDRGEWEAFLDSIDARDIATIQTWLPAQEGLEGNFTLEERIEQARNSDRGATALTRIDAVAAVDVNNDPPRITERMRELLALGVAMPRVEGTDNGGEGVLSVIQAERAAQALVYMPAREYARVLLLVSLTGSESGLEQSFLLLKSTAARLDSFTDADNTHDSMAHVEDMADGIRELSGEDAVVLTQVTGLNAGDIGLQQQFTMSCAPASGLVMRAESDPTEAYRLNTTFSTGTGDLDGEAAGITESALERYGVSQVAQARQPGAMTADVNTSITELGAALSVAESTAVTSYMSGTPFVQANFDTGIQKVRDHLDMDGYPNAQAIRLIRETTIGGNAQGMVPADIATEYNNDAGLNIDGVTGASYTADIDATLQGYRGTLVGRNYPAVLPAGIVTQVNTLLSTAASRLEQGYDVGFGVLWSGSGGHAMSMTDVQGAGAARQYLVHNTWSGTTEWVTTAQFQQANLPMGRGLIYRLARPD